MTDAYSVKPDAEFSREIAALGGENVKKCYQCATCSTMCSLSPDSHPFPRKEMVWAQWGLKDKLFGDPDVWLCHRCGDCNTHCPRKAGPGDVLAAVRDAQVRHYAFPSFMGNLFGRPKLIPLLLAVPAVLLLIVLGGIGHLNVPAGEVEYAHFFPHTPLQVFFTSFSALMVIAVVMGIRSFWAAMKENAPPVGTTNPLIPSIIETFKDILTHKKFRECSAHQGRNVAHLFAFYGFIGLLFTTTFAVYYAYFVDGGYPFGFWHWCKILGNLSTLSLAIGLILLINDRVKLANGSESVSSNDWTFIVLMATVVGTGFLTEVFRYAQLPGAIAYGIYYIHLVFVFSLLIYLPYSRFAHVVYRTVAMVYAKHSGREPVPVNKEDS